MINANEARKMMKKNSVHKDEMRRIVENILPTLDEHIRRVVGFGGKGAVITRDEIMANVGLTAFTKKEILDAVIKELGRFGFKAEATPSYSSVHVEW